MHNLKKILLIIVMFFLIGSIHPQEKKSKKQVKKELAVKNDSLKKIDSTLILINKLRIQQKQLDSLLLKKEK